MNFSLFRKKQPPPDPKKKDEQVFLHIGLHKTGSTHLQGVFKANRAVLAKSGVYYLPIKQCRDTFTVPCVHKKLGAVDRGTAFFQEAFSTNQTALISDENIAGVVDTLLIGHFYPKLARNIKRVRHLAGRERKFNIYCCIRNYADWIESAYLQTLKRKVTSFESFLEVLKPEEFSWLRLLEGMNAAGKPAEIAMWTYESYNADCEAILRDIGRDLGTTFVKPADKRPNPSLSETAVRILLASEKYVRREDRSKLHRFLRLNFSTNQKYEKPQLLPTDLRNKLTQNYRNDVRAIQQLPYVRMLGVDAMQKGLIG